MTTPLELEAMAYDWRAVDGNLSSAIPDFYFLIFFEILLKIFCNSVRTRLPIFTELNYLLVLKYV